MKKYLPALLVLTLAATNLWAQEKGAAKNKKENKKPAAAKTEPAKTETSPLDLAKAALAAHGGDKFKNMKSLVVRGSADISGSPTTTFPAGFVTIYAGDKYRLEISNPFQPFKQVYNGTETFSSINGFTLPPINRLGLPLLPKIGEDGYTVSALPEKSKFKTGFRITSPEGYYTDFSVDDKTGQVKAYEASYDFGSRTVTTSVEIDKLRDVEGVLVPERYAQRFDTGSLTIYADFKAKEILVNTEIADDIFTMN